MVHLVIITLNIKVMEVKKTSIEQYLEKIRIYLGDMTDKLKKTGEQKIHLTMKNNFLSSKVDVTRRLLNSETDNIKIMIGNETDEIIK